MEHILAKGRKSREKHLRAVWRHGGVLSLLALAACGDTTSEVDTVSVTVSPDELDSPGGRINVVTDQLFVEGATVDSTYFIDLTNFSYAGEDPRFTVIVSPTLHDSAVQTILDVDYDSETQLLSFRGTSDLATHENVITTVSIGVTSVIRSPGVGNVTESLTETIEITLAAIDDDPLVNLENQFILNDDFASTTFSLKALREGEQGLFDEEGDAYSVAFTTSGLPSGYSLQLTTVTLDQREYESLEVVAGTGAPALTSGNFTVTVTYSEYELEGVPTSELNRIIDPFEVVYTIAFAETEGAPPAMDQDVAPLVSVVVMNADGTQTPQIGSSFPTLVEEITLMEGEGSSAGFVTLIDIAALFTSDGDGLIYGFDYTLDDSVSGISVEWAGEETELQHQLTISGMPTFVDDNDVYLTISAYAYDTSFVTVSHTFTIALQNTLEAPDQIDTLQDIMIFEESRDPYTFDMSRIFQKQSALNNPDTYVSYSVDARVGSPNIEDRIELKASTEEFSIGEQLAASLTFQDDLAVLRAPNLISGDMPLVIYYTIHGFGAEDTPGGDTKTSRATSVLLTVTVSNVEEDFRMLSETFSTEFDPNAATVIPLADRVRETNNLDLSLAGTYAINYIDGSDTVTETVTVSSQVLEHTDPNDPLVVVSIETIYAPLVLDEERELATSLTIDAAGSFVFEDDTVGVDSNITYRIDLAQHDVYLAENVRLYQTDALDVWQQTIGNQLADWWIADLSLSIDADTGLLTVGGQPQIFGTSDDTATITVGIIAEKDGVTLTDSFLLAVENTNDGPQIVPKIGAATPEGDSAIPTLTLTDNNALSGSGEAIFLTTIFEDIDGDSLIYTSISVDASTGETSVVDMLTLLESTDTFDLTGVDSSGADVTVGMVSGLEVTVSKLGVITVNGAPLLQHLSTTINASNGLITETVMDSNGDTVETIFASMQFDIDVLSWFQDTHTALDANGNFIIDLDPENRGAIRQSFELRILPHASDPAYYAIDPEMTQITEIVSGSSTTKVTTTIDPIASEFGTTYSYTLQDTTHYLNSTQTGTVLPTGSGFYTWNLDALIGDPDFVSDLASDISFEIVNDLSSPLSFQNGTVEMSNNLSDDDAVVRFSITPHELTKAEVLQSVGVGTGGGTSISLDAYETYELVWAVEHRELSDLDVNLLMDGGNEILAVSGNATQRQITGSVPYTIDLRGTDSNGGEEDFRIVLFFNNLDDGGNEAVRARKDEISYSVVGLKNGVRTTLGDRQTLEDDRDREFPDLTFNDQESQNLQWNLNDFFVDSEGDAITYSLAAASSGELTGMSANIQQTGSSYFLNVIGTPSIVQTFDPANAAATLSDGVFAVTVTASNLQESLSVSISGTVTVTQTVTTTVSLTESFSITFDNVDSPLQFKDDETPTITVDEDSTNVVIAEFTIVDPDTTTPFGQGLSLDFDYDTDQFSFDIAYQASGNISIGNPNVLQTSNGVAIITASVHQDILAKPSLGELTFTVTINQENDVVSQTLAIDKSYLEDRRLDTEQIDLRDYVRDDEADAITFSLRDTNANFFLSNGISYELNGTMLTISGTPDIPEASTTSIVETFLLDMSDGSANSLFSFTHTIDQTNDAPRARFVATVDDGTVLQYLRLGGFSLTESDTSITTISVAPFDFTNATVVPFIDPEGTALSFTPGTLMLSGNTDYLDSTDAFRVSLSAAGVLSLTGTPNLIGTGENVTIYFDVVVMDTTFAGLPTGSTANSTTQRLAVPIMNINDSPETTTASISDISIAEEASLMTVIEMDDYVTDDDADVLAFRAAVEESGTSIDLSTSTIDTVTWTHVDDWGISFYFDEFDQLNINGTVQLPEPTTAFSTIADSLALTLSVTATDPDAESATLAITIDIANTNDAPVLQSPVGDLILEEDVAISAHVITLDIEDLDGDPFTVTYVEEIDAGYGISFTFSNNTIILDGDPNIPVILRSNGSVSPKTSDAFITVTYVGYDFVGGATVTDSFTIEIDNQNDSPSVLTTLDTITLVEDTFVPSSYQLRTIIGDAEGNPLSFAASVGSALMGVTVDIVNGDTLTVTATPEILSGGHANITTTMAITAWESDLGTDPTTISMTELLIYTIDVVVTNINDKPEVISDPTAFIGNRLTAAWDVEIYSNPGASGNLLIDHEGDTIYFGDYTITSDDPSRFPDGVIPQYTISNNTNSEFSIEFAAWDAGEFLTPGDATLLLSLEVADALDTDNNALDPDRTSSLVLTITFDNPNEHAPVHISEQIDQISEGIALDLTWTINFTDDDVGDTVSTVGVEYNGSVLTGAIFSVSGSDNRITLSNVGSTFPQLAAGTTAPRATDILTVTGSDGKGGFVTTTVTFTVENRDDAPVAYTEFETVSFVEDSAVDEYRLTLANYIRDPELHGIRFGLDADAISTMVISGLQSDNSEDDFSFSASITDDGVLVLDGTPDFDGGSATHSLTIDIFAFSSIRASNSAEVSLNDALSATFMLSIEVEQTNDTPYFNVSVLEAGHSQSFSQTFNFDETMGWAALTSETFTLDHMFIDTEQAPDVWYSFPDLTIASNVLYDPSVLSLVSFTVETNTSATISLGGKDYGQTLSLLSFTSAPDLRGHEDGTLTLSISANDGEGGQVVQLVTLVLENPNETAAEVTTFSIDSALPNVATIVEDAALPTFVAFMFADPDTNGTVSTSISITDVSITSGFNIAAQVATSTDNLTQTVSFTAIDSAHVAATISAGFSDLDAYPELTITYIDPIGTNPLLPTPPTATYTYTLTLTIENVDNPVELPNVTRHTFDNSTEGQAYTQQFLISDLFFDRDGDSITYSLSISSDEQGNSIDIGYGLTMAIVSTTGGDMITISGTPEIVGQSTDATIAVDLRGWSDGTTIVDFPLFLTIENENDPVLSIATAPIVTLNEGQSIGASGRIALASIASDDDANTISVIDSQLVASSNISGLSVSFTLGDFMLTGTPELLGADNATQTLRVTFDDGVGAANSQAILDFIININNVDDAAVAVGILPTLSITQDVSVSDGTNPSIRVDLNDYFQDPEGFSVFGVSDISWTPTTTIGTTVYTLTTANTGLQLDSTNAGSSGQFTLSGIPHLAISTTDNKLSQTDGNFAANIFGEINVSATGATPAGEAGNIVTGKVIVNLAIDAAPVTVTDTHANWNASTTLFELDGGLHRMTIDMNDYFADTDVAPESLTFTVSSSGASAMRLSAFDAEIEEDGQFVGYVYGTTTFTVVAEDSFHAATATFVMKNFGEDLSTLPSSSASADVDNGRVIEGFRINGGTYDSRFGSAVATGTYTESGTTKQLYLIGAPYTKPIHVSSNVSGNSSYGGEVYIVLDDFIASATTTIADGVKEYNITDLTYSDADSKRFGLIIRGEDAPQPDEFGENLGSVLANIGDFNGDNIDDYAIGGRQYADDLINRSVYILYGRDEWGNVGTASLNNYRVIDTSLWDTETNLGEKFEITTQAGTRSDIALGERFAHGDLNNDGYSDLIIAAPSFASDAGGVKISGAAVVVYGKANGLDGEVHDLGASTNSDKVLWIESVATSSGALGYDIATTQFNNDTIDDLVLTRHGKDEVIIVYGNSALGSAASDGRQVLNIDDSALTGNQTTVFKINKDPTVTDTRELKSVAFGDFDGDGREDLAIGVGRTLKVTDTDPGYLYIVYGSDDGAGYNYGNTGDSISYDLDVLVTNGDAARFSFLTAGEGFGFDMDSGNLNGDMYDDLLIGVPNGENAQGEYGAGGSLMFFGAANLATDYSYAMQWNDADDNADTARSVDVDGTTAIVGAAYEGELDTGAAYVFEWDG